MRILLAEDEKDLNHIIAQKLTVTVTVWTAASMEKKRLRFSHTPTMTL